MHHSYHTTPKYTNSLKISKAFLSIVPMPPDSTLTIINLLLEAATPNLRRLYT